MKLFSNLWQVGGTALTHPYDATAYLLNTNEGLYLLDCATPEGYEQLLDNIRKTGHDPRCIRAILGTHGHYDHVGAAALFQRDFGTELHLHRLDAAQVEAGDDVKTTAALLYDRHFPPAKVHHELQDGQRFMFADAQLEVLHTPGHTPGGVCFVLEHAGETLLIAGDTLWGGFQAKVGSDEEQWRASMDLLCSRHFDYFTFGHTPPQLYADADRRLQEARQQLAVYYNPWFRAPSKTYQY